MRADRNEIGKLVVVGGEHRAAADGVVQVLGNRPGDGQAIVGARAASDLVEHDQRAPGGSLSVPSRPSLGTNRPAAAMSSTTAWRPSSMSMTVPASTSGRV